MPAPDGERLAALEAAAQDLRDDVGDLKQETLRTRDRLHKVEKVTEGLLTLQRELHRQNDLRMRRLALSVQWAGFALTFGMLALAVTTFLVNN